MSLRQDLAAALSDFPTLPLQTAAHNFWKTLGYSSDLTLDLQSQPQQLAAELGIEWPADARWKAMHFLFQITTETLQSQNSLFGAQTDLQRDKSYLFFALELQNPVSRSELAKIARAVNRPFASPILLLVRTGVTLHLAIVDRRANKKDAGKEVLEKVTLIRDIEAAHVHPGHLRILEDLAIPGLKAANWDELHREWKRVLDLSLLNKKFFGELSNWYFAARQRCTFPQPQGDTKSAEEHVSTALIRLLTRVIFAYFLKERGLVPAALFDPKTAPGLTKGADESSYYKAVLQNLFFATLNTEISQRGWKKPDAGSRNPQFLVHNVWRYQNLWHDPHRATQLFGEVPFLNGGLFECLDKAQNDRCDGFSERRDNVLHVPNDLFFGSKLSADLNADYDTKGKTYLVTPLLELFASYKFTVSENTPLEEDVALDPELLGKVFENLLASYNPETRATARKQSGSFYTPREIVDYMVEESLVAYLQDKVEISETDIRALLSNPNSPTAQQPILYCSNHSCD